MISYWVLALRDGLPHPVRASLEDWAAFMETPDSCRVGLDETNGTTVSTVFLGLDPECGRFDRPLLFESMVMGGQLDGAQDRYRTWAEAVEGHAELLAVVQDLEHP